MTFFSSQARAIFLCLLVLAAAGCQRQAEISARESEALKALLAAAGTAKDDPQLRDQTRKFYELRQNQPAWIVAGEPLPAVQSLTTVLAASADEGLNPQEYAFDALTAKVQGLKGNKDLNAATALELELTQTLLRYGSHIALGHPVAKQIDGTWNVTPREIDLAGIVQKAVAGNDLEKLADELAPPHPEYARVREMLQRYRKIAAEGKLQVIPADLKLKAGEPSPHLAALRNNLLILGDMQEEPRGGDNVFNEDLSKAQDKFEERNATQPEKTPDAKQIAVIDTYDENLGEAVRRFESRHGMDPDGVPGTAMIEAMNVPAAERARQLALNLERWRWMPADFGTPHILVNIASYSMQVRDAREAVPLKMRVIAGQPIHRTPVFSDTMTKIVFSPYWNIPESIEVKEMWPSIVKDSNYLEKKDIEVVRYEGGKAIVIDPSSIDWANAKSEADFQLRQKSGPSNSLGYVKFLFPNRYNVYLHDTPADNLFDKLTRDLSHGCVRLEQPEALAVYLLRDQPEWTAERIKTAMHAGKEEEVMLKNPIAVHLVYLTARVDEDGVPQFFSDVYGYDFKQQELAGL
ncbi:MAG: L,D-transpeptidase family protein [Panacagrimonas sp.]